MNMRKEEWLPTKYMMNSDYLDDKMQLCDSVQALGHRLYFVGSLFLFQARRHLTYKLLLFWSCL